MTSGLPLIKKAKGVLIPLGLTAAASATYAATQKKFMDQVKQH